MDQSPEQFEPPSISEGPVAERHVDAPDVKRCADRLSVVSERMQFFLHTQIDTLQNVAHHMDAAAQQISEYETKSLELEQRQAQWEQQKERETKRMAEDARLLSQAWDHIEEERRECLATGSGIELPLIESPASAESVPQVSEQAPASHTDTDLFDLGVPMSTQTPAVQFQQMKREISQHARRNR